MIAVEHSPSLKPYVWTLAILNLLDGMLTFVGLTSGLITEGNPLLSSFSPILILTIKLFLSLCLLGLLFTPFIFIQSSMWRYLLISANALYSIILFLHAVWLTLLFI